MCYPNFYICSHTKALYSAVYSTLYSNTVQQHCTAIRASEIHAHITLKTIASIQGLARASGRGEEWQEQQKENTVQQTVQRIVQQPLRSILYSILYSNHCTAHCAAHCASLECMRVQAHCTAHCAATMSGRGQRPQPQVV